MPRNPWRAGRAVANSLVAMLAAVTMAAAQAADDPKQLTLTEASLADLAGAMRSGATSSVELTVMHLNRIMLYDRRGPKLNAVPVLNPRALQEAARADALRRLGVELGPLHGIPIVVKDSYNVVGLPTSVGIAAWKGLRPVEDAFVVARMRQAGAVLLGKANLDTFAASSEGVSEAFGAVNNPYGAKAVGGSSAGSAVAVAAHLAAISFGGDTAGSLRMPASRNAVVSLRPTIGLISTSGTAPGDPLFDVVGPMARTVEDLSLVLDIVAVPDAQDPLNARLPPPDERGPQRYSIDGAPRSLRNVTFAVPRRLLGERSEGARRLTPGKPILQAFGRIRSQLTQAGARVIDVDVPADDVLDDTWYYDQDVSQAGEAAKAIYDARVALVNIRAFAGEFAKFCRGWCGDPADRMLDIAALFDYPEFMQAFEVLRQGTVLDMSSEPVAAAMRNAEQIAEGPLFGKWLATKGIDALLFPASSDADSDTRFGLNYLSELGAPGLFIPAAYVEPAPKAGLQPLGVALVAARFRDRRLLELGSAVEKVLHARVNPPSTPALADEKIALDPGEVPPAKRGDKEPPALSIDAVETMRDATGVIVSGSVSDRSSLSALRIYVNGTPALLARNGKQWTARLEQQGGADALCVPDGLILAFAEDASGNAAAAFETFSGGCSP